VYLCDAGAAWPLVLPLGAVVVSALLEPLVSPLFMLPLDEEPLVEPLLSMLLLLEPLVPAPASTPSAARVLSSSCPLASRPCFCWKLLIAAVVFGPIMPSAGPGLKPLSLNCC